MLTEEQRLARNESVRNCAAKKQTIINEYKSDYGCKICGEKDLIVELQKCDVLCANCHRRKTYAERH